MMTVTTKAIDTWQLQQKCNFTVRGNKRRSMLDDPVLAQYSKAFAFQLPAVHLS